MAFHTGSYDVYLLVTKGPAPWMRTQWPKVARALDPLVACAEPPAAVRSFQYGRGSSADPKFGRLGWDEKSHSRWTVDGKAPRTLLDMELWAPGWTRCVKRDRAPDVYFSMHNPRCIWTKSIFSSAIVLAISVTLGSEALTQGRTTAVAIADALATVARVRRRRAWGRTQYGGFTDAIGDLLATGSPFTEGWERLPRAKLRGSIGKGWKPF